MHKTFPCGHPYIRGKLFRPLFRDQMKGRPLTVRLAGTLLGSVASIACNRPGSIRYRPIRPDTRWRRRCRLAT